MITSVCRHIQVVISGEFVRSQPAVQPLFGPYNYQTPYEDSRNVIHVREVT